MRATGAGLVLELDDVKDGAHRVRVQASPSRIFGDSVDEAFTIHVDTRRPSLALDQAASGWLSASELTGRVEPGSTLAVSYPGGRLVMHAASGAFDLDPKLPDGRTTVQLIASDRAGNRCVITRTFAVDRAAPRLHVDHVPAVLGTAHPTLRGSIDDFVAGDPSRRCSTAARSRCAVPTAPRCSARLRPRAASRCRSSTSRRGSTRSRSRPPTVPATPRPPRLGPFTVDSTEKLRPASVLSLGARGADVVQLERRLKAFGTYHGPFTRFYNERTAVAVRSFQRAHDLPVTGVATPQVLQLSAERIVVHLSKFRVFLIREGKRVFSAPIAIGQPAYPTPTGHYEIIAKIKNPHLGAAQLALGGRARADSARRHQPARFALDRHECTQHRLPRHPAGLERRARGVARLHAHASRRRRAPLRSDPRGHAGRH